MEKVLFKEKKQREFKKESTDLSPLIRIVMNIGFIVLAAFLSFNSVRSIQLAQEKLKILDRAQIEVTDLRLRNIALMLEKNKIETDDYTETDIRNRLNYSKKNEVIFVIPEDILAISTKEVEDIVKKERELVETKEVWEVWKDLFIYGI